MVKEYLENIKTQFLSYKEVADKSIAQLNNEDLHWQYNSESNSIAMLMIHLSENMLSRWTDFFTTDGEKLTRNRDLEFEIQNLSHEQLLLQWENGWNCLFTAINSLNEVNFNTPILIRNKKVKLIQSLTRQIAHYPYHIGQISYIAKMILNTKWKTTSIAKGKSKEFIENEFKKNSLSN